MKHSFILGIVACANFISVQVAAEIPSHVAMVARSSCLDRDASTVQQVLSFEIQGANDDLTDVIKRTMQTFNVYNGRSFDRAFSGIKFIVQDGLLDANGQPATGLTHLINRTIKLDGSVLGDKNVAAGIVAHEICHLIQQLPLAGGVSALEAYNQMVPASCNVSAYAAIPVLDTRGHTAASLRQEEFAEACSAQIVAPGFVRGLKSDSCTVAANFIYSLFNSPSPGCGFF